MVLLLRQVQSVVRAIYLSRKSKMIAKNLKERQLVMNEWVIITHRKREREKANLWSQKLGWVGCQSFLLRDAHSSAPGGELWPLFFEASAVLIWALHVVTFFECSHLYIALSTSTCRPWGPLQALSRESPPQLRPCSHPLQAPACLCFRPERNGWDRFCLPLSVFYFWVCSYLNMHTHKCVCLCVSVAQRIGTARFLAGLSLHMCSVAASVGLGPSHVLTSGSSFVTLLKIMPGFAFV